MGEQTPKRLLDQCEQMAAGVGTFAPNTNLLDHFDEVVRDTPKPQPSVPREEGESSEATTTDTTSKPPDEGPLPLRHPEETRDIPFPIEALTGTLRAATRAIEELTQASLATCGQSVLAAACLTTQPLCDVMIRGSKTPLSNFFITIAESGERKSSVDKIALFKIRDHYMDKHVEWAAREKRHEEEVEAYKQKPKKERNMCEPPEELPPMPLCTIKEPTYEALVNAYLAGQLSLGLFSDEGGQFLGGYAMSADNIGRTAAGLSDLWDGGPVERARAEGTKIAYGRRLSVHLMIQPTFISNLFGKQLVGQGLLGRILVSRPEVRAGHRKFSDKSPADDGRIQRYNAKIKALLEARKPDPTGEELTRGLTNRVIHLHEDARKQWQRYWEAVEKDMGQGRRYESTRDFAGKAGEIAVRLAAVMTVFEDPSATHITKETMLKGITLVEYYLSETLKLRGEGEASLDNELSAEQVNSLCEVALKCKLLRTKDRFTTKQFMDRGPMGCRRADKARIVLAALQSSGHVMPLAGRVVIDGVRTKNGWQVLRHFDSQ